jgi:hypothetical protein
MWVFREPPEKWLDECVHPKPKPKGNSLMVWGCFFRGTKGPLVPIRQSVTGVRYRRLLSRHLPRFIRKVLEIHATCSFQQDNAPVHKADTVMNWLYNNDIEVEDHPPYSPDLNPIEHVWVELKKRLQQQYPKIGDTKGGKEAVKKRLAEVLPLVWETISEEFFEKLWRSMPNRVAAVVEAKGWYTRY